MGLFCKVKHQPFSTGWFCLVFLFHWNGCSSRIKPPVGFLNSVDWKGNGPNFCSRIRPSSLFDLLGFIYSWQMTYVILYISSYIIYVYVICIYTVILVLLRWMYLNCSEAGSPAPSHRRSVVGKKQCGCTKDPVWRIHSHVPGDFCSWRFMFLPSNWQSSNPKSSVPTCWNKGQEEGC